ncbi:MAG: J domain-containing protein [Flavobacteriales bacterium]|nr:J domain-containing protein [Flavobacteriales bacterium]
MEGMLRFDHYKVLGVPRDASPKHIKQAYRRRVKDCHPDRNASPHAAVIFHAVHEAYEVLCDKELRARYDERLRFYRPASRTEEPIGRYMRPQVRTGTEEEEVPPTRFQRSVFIGLHITGLLFGVSSVAGILVSITFLGWPAPLLFFTLPGLAAIPASLEGLSRTGGT